MGNKTKLKTKVDLALTARYPFSVHVISTFEGQIFDPRLKTNNTKSAQIKCINRLSQVENSKCTSFEKFGRFTLTHFSLSEVKIKPRLHLRLFSQNSHKIKVAN